MPVKETHRGFRGCVTSKIMSDAVIHVFFTHCYNFIILKTELRETEQPAAAA